MLLIPLHFVVVAGSEPCHTGRHQRPAHVSTTKNGHRRISAEAAARERRPADAGACVQGHLDRQTVNIQISSCTLAYLVWIISFEAETDQ